ncbi:hypothetical protein F5Y15DRAFT_143651 [Xylariaceae sp. FL0016]|nr:hypothetical protein F5Y15DRAFT_143651 [Xylariaceae sp. FL0016]
MPPSSKRNQRARKARDPSPSPAPADQSSPTRPAKRRRKIEEPPSEPIEDESSSLTIEAPAQESSENSPTDDQLINQVTQHLRNITTHASVHHANAILETSPVDIEAYAKIAAHEWTYFIRSVNVNIGRTSDNPNDAKDINDPEYIHVDLGPNKTFSRLTAVIFFDTDAGKWYVQAKGRNGLMVDNEPLMKSDAPHSLVSGEVIKINGLEMMFVLPGHVAPLRINPTYLEQAGLRPPSRDARTALPPLPASERASSQSAAGPPSSRGQSFQQPIAPAPPDYKRPGTPPSAKSRPTASHAKTPGQGSSTVVMSQSDIDLSADDNKHIKPAFSYAQMITQAIMTTAELKLNLNGIYTYITKNYAYYRHQQPNGWQNSIRHNLSLNKAFNKAPRSTDEPGKGMKWEIVPEQRDEMMKGAWKGGRGGHRGSSAPSSPNQPNGMTYITSGPKDMASKGPGSTRKRRGSPTTSPPPRSSLAQSAVTPDRRLLSTGPGSVHDGSPLPRTNRRANASSSFASEVPRSPPTLSSSYLPEEGNSFVTPAPLRVNPRLAPPSTAQRPSQHMPVSSPAPFWKYADINSTPLRPFDMSPLRTQTRPIDSSPPPPGGDDMSPIPSPSRSTRRGEELPHREATVEKMEKFDEEEDGEEEGGFDLTKGFQTIGSYHLGGAPPKPPGVDGRA